MTRDTPSKDPKNPTATAPDSVEQSVPEAAEHAGKQGPNAADPPEAAKKSEGEVEPDEGADVFETSEDADEKQRESEPDRSDEDIITLDTPD